MGVLQARKKHHQIGTERESGIPQNREVVPWHRRMGNRKWSVPFEFAGLNGGLQADTTGIAIFEDAESMLVMVVEDCSV